MIWQNIIKTYDNQIAKGRICPIAHTKILANIGIMLNEQSKILAAAKIRQSIFAPCTVKSEGRSSNIAPHLVHDNVSYVSNINPARHAAYMEQMGQYVADTGDRFCKIVFDYLQKETICDDLQHLVDLKDNHGLNIIFGIKGYKESTVNYRWIKYHLAQLPKNGVCAITGEADHIPDSYPGGIRYPGDMAKLFMAKSDKLDSMPQFRAGYRASQKIIHTLQYFFSDWTDQGEIPLTDIVISQKTEA